MKTYFFVTLAAALMLYGCSKKEQALEDMQQPMSPEDLTRITTQTVTNETAAAAVVPAVAPEATIVSTAGDKLEPLPPSGPYKPTGKEIQLCLKNAGLYTGNIDGKIGPMSKQAIEEFQKSNGLEPDGKVGPKTWQILSKYLNPVPASVAASAPAKE